MDAKRWMIFIVIVVAIIGGMVYMSGQNRLDVSDIGKSGAAKIIGAEDRNGNIEEHVFGKKDSKVVLIEYADYQCSGCASIAPKVKTLAEKYKNQIAVVSRSFPITNSHPNSRAASAAAEAAALQDKYWEMHDLLFENQSSWAGASISERTDFFVSYANQLGLNADKFKKDMGSEKVTKKIDFDVALAKLQGVNETPSFFIGDKPVDTRTGENAIEDAIKKAMKDAGIEFEEEKPQN